MKPGNSEDKLTFRSMNEEDVDEVYQIERVCFPHPWSPDLFVGETRKAGFSFFRVMELNGKIVGYAGYWKIRREAHIVNLAIHPDFRRRGLGSKLLGYLTAQIRSEQMSLVTLEVRRTNIAAQRLYEKFGFQKVALRRAYYQDTGESAIVYWKRL